MTTLKLNKCEADRFKDESDDAVLSLRKGRFGDAADPVASAYEYVGDVVRITAKVPGVREAVLKELADPLVSSARALDVALRGYLDALDAIRSKVESAISREEDPTIETPPTLTLVAGGAQS